MYLYISESVSPGHPDKCADIIADTIVDRLLELDSNAKVATEVFITGKHIVASGLAKKALVELAYVIGNPKPINVTINRFDMAKGSLGDEELSKIVAEKFSLTPLWIKEKFGLDKPSEDTFLYADIAARGQVGYPDYPWERLDELEFFKALL